MQITELPRGYHYYHSQSTLRKDEAVEGIVAEILADVNERGEEALLDSARKFDSPNLDSIWVTEQEIEEASIPEDVHEAIQEAHSRVREFHQRQLDAMTAGLDEGLAWSHEGVGQRLVRMQKVGVYVPGGRAAYPSSVIMNAVPALVAGVDDVVIATPVGADGNLPAAVLVAMREIGIRRAMKVGGAAAIAGMALVEGVDKIVGPGNRYVNEAKKQLFGICGFDGYAGSSEVCVIADEHADAKFAAVDLLTQIEHAPDNLAYLISWSKAKIEEILRQCEELIPLAKDPEGIRKAYELSHAMLVADATQAVGLANSIAPEHLTLAVAEPEALAPLLTTAGCILMGEWTPESAGDYMLGPSHTLPTARAGRFQSPVNVMDFFKFQSVSRMSAESIQPLIPHIEAIARAEGFSMHGLGATLRRIETDHLSEVKGC